MIPLPLGGVSDLSLFNRFGVSCIGCLSRTNRPRESSFQLLREGRRVRTRKRLTRVGALDGVLLLSRKTQVFCPSGCWCLNGSRLRGQHTPLVGVTTVNPHCQGCLADDTALAVDFATWSAPVRGPCVSTLPKRDCFRTMVQRQPQVWELQDRCCGC